MASLIKELIAVMEAEQEIYAELLPVAEKKTKVIIQNDLEALQDITELEQITVEKINVLEKKRLDIISNIGIVMNKKPETLNVKKLVELLKNQPKEQKQLCTVHDSLKKTVNRLVEMNDRNKSLIEQSLDMIEFNMNLIQSTRMSPGTNNYTKQASQWKPVVAPTGMFDARQ